MSRTSAPQPSPDARVRRFSAIAGVYDLFFRSQARTYRRIFRAHCSALALPDRGREHAVLNREHAVLNREHAVLNREHAVLDIGCGTGAFAFVLSAEGFHARGIDASAKMIRRARRRLRGRGVRLEVADPFDGLPFAAGSFDLVLSSWVLHGFASTRRRKFLREALRVSRGKVLIHDYPQIAGPWRARGIFIRFLELLEGGDYYGFVQSGLEDMRAVAGTVTVIPVAEGAAWYLLETAS